jgi:hypothetical protein
MVTLVAVLPSFVLTVTSSLVLQALLAPPAALVQEIVGGLDKLTVLILILQLAFVTLVRQAFTVTVVFALPAPVIRGLHPAQPPLRAIAVSQVRTVTVLILTHAQLVQ